MSVQIGNVFREPVAISEADLIGNVDQVALSPNDGFLDTIAVIVTKTITTGGTLTVRNSAGTAIPGLVITIPNSAAKGAIYKATATKGAVERAIAKDGLLYVTPAGFATAGSVRTYLTVNANTNPQQPY